VFAYRAGECAQAWVAIHRPREFTPDTTTARRRTSRARSRRVGGCQLWVGTLPNSDPSWETACGRCQIGVELLWCSTALGSSRRNEACSVQLECLSPHNLRSIARPIPAPPRRLLRYTSETLRSRWSRWRSLSCSFSTCSRCFCRWSWRGCCFTR
jgi:hypothetical protein